jgi:inositol transport system ATP-binding protein
MDEPTSALSEKEIARLFEILNELRRSRGISIIYISHKLDEVFAFAENVTVLRDGESILTKETRGLSKADLIEAMIGRKEDEYYLRKASRRGDIALDVRNLSVEGVLEDISFSVSSGEVVGIAGLVGSGRTELMETIFGARKASAGEIFVKGKRVRIDSPADAIRSRLAFVTEDRKLTGLFMNFDIKGNMIIPDMGKVTKLGLVSGKATSRLARDMKDQLRIKAQSVDSPIDSLSGGNQQKVLIARWLLIDPEILILDEPTRGIDVGAKRSIHELIGDLAAMGKAVLIVSSELPEVLAMSDRILVMHEGKIAGELSRDEATQARVLTLATGLADERSEL